MQLPRGDASSGKHLKEHRQTLQHAVDLLLHAPIRSAPKPPRAPPPLEGVSLNELRELLQTEQTYVADLQKLVDLFLKPMRGLGPRTFPSKYEAAIFANVEELLAIHRELLLPLNEPAGRTPSGASAAFERVSPRFIAYAQYASSYMDAAPRLQKLRERSGDHSILEAVLQDGERKAGQQLTSLLIKPVQRLCKYPLLFRELLKAVKEDGDSWEAVTAAARAVEAVAQKVNEEVRANEGKVALAQIADTLGSAGSGLVTPSRTLMLTVEGPGGADGAYNQQLHQLHLCNDCLLITTATSGGARALAKMGLGEKNCLVMRAPIASIRIEKSGLGSASISLRLTIDGDDESAADDGDGSGGAASSASASSAAAAASACSGMGSAVMRKLTRKGGKATAGSTAKQRAERWGVAPPDRNATRRGSVGAVRTSARTSNRTAGFREDGSYSFTVTVPLRAGDELLSTFGDLQERNGATKEQQERIGVLRSQASAAAAAFEAAEEAELSGSESDEEAPSAKEEAADEAADAPSAALRAVDVSAEGGDSAREHRSRRRALLGEPEGIRFKAATKALAGAGAGGLSALNRLAGLAVEGLHEGLEKGLVAVERGAEMATGAASIAKAVAASAINTADERAWESSAVSPAGAAAAGFPPLAPLPSMLEEDEIEHSATSRPLKAPPDAPPPPPFKPALSRRLSKAEVADLSRDVLAKVGQLDQLVRSLSTDGTTLAAKLGEMNEHAGAPRAAAPQPIWHRRRAEGGLKWQEASSAGDPRPPRRGESLEQLSRSSVSEIAARFDGRDSGVAGSSRPPAPVSNRLAAEKVGAPRTGSGHRRTQDQRAGDRRTDQDDPHMRAVGLANAEAHRRQQAEAARLRERLKKRANQFEYMNEEEHQDEDEWAED